MERDALMLEGFVMGLLPDVDGIVDRATAPFVAELHRIGELLARIVELLEDAQPTYAPKIRETTGTPPTRFPWGNS